MSDAIQVLTDLDISSTITKGPFTVAFSPMPLQRWFWAVTNPSGSGVNTLHILPKQRANYEDDSSDQQEFDLVDTDHFEYPPVITAAQIAASTDTTFKFVGECANNIRRLLFDFTYLGGGSQVFRINLWVE